MDPERGESGLPEVAALPRDVMPDARLEDRTVNALMQQRLLHPGRGRARHKWQVAAALLLFLGGVSVGRTTSTTSAVNQTFVGSRYLLVLHGGPTARDEAEEARVVAEYRAWAISLRDAGRFVSGERLGNQGAIVPAVELPELEGLRGFFLISAKNLDDAAAVASACPHARRGGHVIVREIVGP